MRTRSKFLVGAVIVLAGLAAAGIYFSRRVGPAVAAAIEAYGTNATGTKVRVGNVAVSLRQSRATVSGLVVGNPSGYTAPYALRIDETAVDLDVPSLARQAIELRDVTLQGATLNVEQRDASTNLTAILDRLEHGGAPAGAAGASPSGGEQTGEAQKLIIDRFELTGGRITLSSSLLDGPQTIELPQVVVKDVGRAEGGLTFDAAAAALLRPILVAARDAVRDRLGKAAGESAKKKLEGAARQGLEQLLKPEAGAQK